MLNEIDIKNLSVAYSHKFVLNNITTNFKKGNLYALIGHNGAGKTTLIKQILKVDLRNTHKISYLDENNEKLTDKHIKYSLSFSPEKPILFEELTVMEYISFVVKMYGSYNQDSKNRIETLLTLFHLENKKNKYIFALSNGMKKKVCHIAALSLNSDFTFLDEPFAALDPVSIYDLKNYIVSNFRETTFIISTHQLDIIDNLPIDNSVLNIRILTQGNLIFNGTKEALLRNGHYKSIEEAYMSLHKS